MDLFVDSHSPDDLAAAVELRAGIHVAATAQAVDEMHPRDAVEVINGFSARGGAVAALAEDGHRRSFLGQPVTVAAALGFVAADAIDILAGAPRRPRALRLSHLPRGVLRHQSRPHPAVVRHEHVRQPREEGAVEGEAGVMEA